MAQNKKFVLSDYYIPLPSQDELHKSVARFKLYMGSFGSGKSKWLIWECLMESLEKPNNNGVVSRATYGELDDTLQKEFLEETPPELIKKWEKTKRRMTLINDSVITFRAFDKVKKIKSLNLGWFAFDQAEEVDEKFFLGLIGRIRRAGFTTKAFLAGNYVPRSWLIKLFLKDKKGHPWFDFVVANTKENTHLPPDYIQTLREMYPESWVNRYVMLNMDSIEKADDGRRYKFSDDHWVNRKQIPYIYDEAPNPEWCQFMIGIDAGVGAPTAVIFSVLDLKDYITQDNGLAKLYFFDEIYEKDKTIEQIAYLIKAKMFKYKLLGPDKEINPKKRIWQVLIDPSTSRRQQGGDSVYNILQLYHRYGIPAVPSINDRAYGIMRFMTMVEKKQLYVAREMENFRIEAENYMSDPGKDHVDDVGVNEMVVDDLPPRKQQDHALDGGRYIIVKIPVYYFSLELKYKDIKAKKALNERRRATGMGARRGLSALSMTGKNGRKERWALGGRV